MNPTTPNKSEGAECGIKQGTLYGFDVVLMAPKERRTDRINEHTLEKYVSSEKDAAVAEFAREVVVALEENRHVVDNKGSRVTTDGFVDTIKSVCRTLAKERGIDLTTL